jgi:hypothetical protein
MQSASWLKKTSAPEEGTISQNPVLHRIVYTAGVLSAVAQKPFTYLQIVVRISVSLRNEM